MEEYFEYEGTTLDKMSPFYPEVQDSTFACAYECDKNPDCTHWGVDYKRYQDTGMCELKHNVDGRKYNKFFRMSGNKGCSRGTVGVGMEKIF